MKNKIIASVLAVCLFVGMAVPAFAIDSTQSGVDADITMTEFIKKEYTIKNGGDLDMQKEFNSFASTKQLVQSPSITWEIKNTTDGKYPFTIDTATGKVFCIDDAGTAEVIATVTGKGDKKYTMKTKVIAAKADNTIKATGFRFADNKFDAVIGAGVSSMKGYDSVNGSNQTLEVVAYPKDAVFTTQQLEDLRAALHDNNELAITGKDASGADVVVRPQARAITENKLFLDYPNGIVAPQTAVYTLSGNTTDTTEKSYTIDGVTFKVPANTTADALAKIIADAYIAYDTNHNMSYVAVKSGTEQFTLTGVKGVITTSAPAMPAIAGITVTPVFTKASSAGGLSSIVTEMNSVKSKGIAASSFHNYTGSSTSNARAPITITSRVATPVSVLNAAGSVTIEVGERKPIKGMFKQGPSNANVKYDLSTPLANVINDTDAIYDDFAVLTGGDDFEIIGVAVGVNKFESTITLPNGDTRSASIVVNVIEKGKKVDPDAKKASLAFDKATVDVGKSVVLAIKDAPTDAATKFVSSDAKIAKVDGTGKITGVAAGNATITVTVGDQTLKAEITVKGAAPVVPEEKPVAPVAPVVPVVPNKPTINPSTGVALLGQLF